MIAVVTGASSGIGWATAEALAKAGIDLIICGRRKERLDVLAHQLSATVRVLPVVFDVRDAEAVQSALGGLPADWQAVDVLINNAGNAHGRDPVQSGSLEDWDAMIDINVKGLLYVSRVLLPGMVERGSGHIVNIGSLAGKEVYPNGNVYCASKHAVDAITQGMRIDLNGTGVRVTAINPGLAETEFSHVRFKGDEAEAAKVYEGYRPLQPEDVAEVIAFAVTRPAHVNIADLLLLPTDQATSTIVDKD